MVSHPHTSNQGPLESSHLEELVPIRMCLRMHAGQFRLSTVTSATWMDNTLWVFWVFKSQSCSLHTAPNPLCHSLLWGVLKPLRRCHIRIYFLFGNFLGFLRNESKAGDTNKSRKKTAPLFSIDLSRGFHGSASGTIFFSMSWQKLSVYTMTFLTLI